MLLDLIKIDLAAQRKSIRSSSTCSCWVRIMIICFIKLFFFNHYRDSAHRIHPMAGQGVNMGFGDVDCLVEILERAVRDGADFSESIFFILMDENFIRCGCSGSLTYLVDYERQRQLQSLARLLSIDSLNRLYSTNFSPIVALRSVGLSFVNEFSPLKVKQNETFQCFSSRSNEFL